MHSKKTGIRDTKKSVKPKRKPVKDHDEFEDDESDHISPPIDEHELEERLADEMLGESDVEDDEQFIQEVEKFKQEYTNCKVISVCKKVGSPAVPDLSKLNPEQTKAELRKFIALLDKHKIIVHFHNDYSDKEKLRFITNEIFHEAVETAGRNTVTFIYEDYHPEMDDDDESENF